VQKIRAEAVEVMLVITVHREMVIRREGRWTFGMIEGIAGQDCQLRTLTEHAKSGAVG
jgi:hypothetical protein